MKYRLKDEKLAESFRALYPKFDEALDTECKDQMGDACNYVVVLLFRGNNDLQDKVFIYKSEIVGEYDPKTWNYWPVIQPPHLASMRVEYNDKYGFLRKTCAQFNDVCSPPGWIDFNGNDIEATELYFRPWED